MFMKVNVLVLPSMILEFLERMTCAPVKKHAYRRRVTSTGKLYSVRKNIFTDYSEKVVGGQPEKAEISALDIQALGLLFIGEAVYFEKVPVLRPSADFTVAQIGLQEVGLQGGD